MTLTFENEQDFDLGFDPEEVAAAVINGVLDQEACPYEAEVELILTDPENIRTMNREHRNIDRETDVLSFPMVDYPSPASFDFLETEEGMPETLKKLKEHGMKLAVCSNKPHPAAVKVIAQLFDGEFDMVVGQSEAIRRKPAPDGPLMVAEKFGVKPEECMYVGDTSTDMKTGKAAGMYTVGALWGFRDRKELNENGADLVAEKPTDLVKICEEHGND